MKDNDDAGTAEGKAETKTERGEGEELDQVRLAKTRVGSAIVETERDKIECTTKRSAWREH